MGAKENGFCFPRFKRDDTWMHHEPSLPFPKRGTHQYDRLKLAGAHPAKPTSHLHQIREKAARKSGLATRPTPFTKL